MRSMTKLIDEAAMSVRAYALSGEDPMLEPYRRALAGIKPSFDTVRRLTNDRAEQRTRVRELESLVDRRLRLIGKTAELLKATGTVETWKFIRAENVDALIESIREKTEEFELSERRLLEERLAAVTSAARLTCSFFMAAMVTNLLIIGVVFMTLGRQMTRRGAAESTLRRSEARFRGIFESASVGMSVVSPDGRWLQVNPALCGITGYSETEMKGIDVDAITHPDDRMADAAIVEAAHAGRISVSKIEKRYIHKAGHLVNVSVSGSVVRNDEGELDTFIAMIEDITARKRAESRLAAQHAVALVLAENRSVEESIPALLRAVGETLEFCIGDYWVVERDSNALVAAESWYGASEDDLEFRRASRRTRFRFGEGLPGRGVGAGAVGGDRERVGGRGIRSNRGARGWRGYGGRSGCP